jgi:hypothetical protein
VDTGCVRFEKPFQLFDNTLRADMSHTPMAQTQTAIAAMSMARPTEERRLENLEGRISIGKKTKVAGGRSEENTRSYPAGPGKVREPGIIAECKGKPGQQGAALIQR